MSLACTGCSPLLPSDWPTRTATVRLGISLPPFFSPFFPLFAALSENRRAETLPTIGVHAPGDAETTLAILITSTFRCSPRLEIRKLPRVARFGEAEGEDWELDENCEKDEEARTSDARPCHLKHLVSKHLVSKHLVSHHRDIHESRSPGVPPMLAISRINRGNFRNCPWGNRLAERSVSQDRPRRCSSMTYYPSDALPRDSPSALLPPFPLSSRDYLALHLSAALPDYRAPRDRPSWDRRVSLSFSRPGVLSPLPARACTRSPARSRCTPH